MKFEQYGKEVENLEINYNPFDFAESNLFKQLDNTYGYVKENRPEIYEKFYHDISLLRDETMSFIHKKHREGKTIWGYGASTKGNTLLQWYGLDNTIISGIAERSPYKFGLKTVGSNIPIFDENVMRTTHPDYLLILPWHFINEFSERERDYLSNGGKFIVPCPRFEIIER